MFQLISVDDMVIGKKYKVDRDLTGIYVKRGYGVCHFDNGEQYLDYRSYYQFVSDNPQWKMERRSVNLFLRKLIGDEYFEW